MHRRKQTLHDAKSVCIRMSRRGEYNEKDLAENFVDAGNRRNTPADCDRLRTETACVGVFE